MEPAADRVPSDVRRGHSTLPGIGVACLALLVVSGLLRALTRHHTFDAIAYASQIELYDRTGKLGLLFHPHHLLFNAIAYVWWQLLREVPGFARPLEAQQILSALAGGAAVALCYAAARRATGSRLLGLGIALLISASYGFWLIATDGGIYALGFALCVGTIALAMRLLEQPRQGIAAALGAVAALAALVHQMHFLMAPVLPAAAFLAGGDRRARLRLALVSGTIYVLLLVSAYTAAAACHGHRTLDDVLRWMTTYARDGRWWSFALAENLHRDLFAVAHVFVPDPTPFLETPLRAGEPLLLWGSGIAVLLLLLLQRSARHRRKQLWLCVVWLLPYVSFFTLWVPGYYAYWVPVAFGLMLAAGLLIEGAIRSLRPDCWGRAVGGTLRLGALATCCLMAWHLGVNHAPVLLRRHEESTNPCLVIARAVAASTRGRDEQSARAGDLIIVAGTGWYAPLETYIGYFAHRNLFTLTAALKHHGPDSGETAEDALRWLRDRIRQSWRHGADVYVFNDVVADPAAAEALQQRYGVTRADLDVLFADCCLDPAFQPRGQRFYRVVARSPVGAPPGRLRRGSGLWALGSGLGKGERAPSLPCLFPAQSPEPRAQSRGVAAPEGLPVSGRTTTLSEKRRDDASWRRRGGGYRITRRGWRHRFPRRRHRRFSTGIVLGRREVASSASSEGLDPAAEP